MYITSRDDLDDLLAVAVEIATVENVTVHDALPEAIRMWTGLRLDIEADARYLPTGQAIRSHVSIAAGVPALDLV